MFIQGLVGKPEGERETTWET